MKSLDQWRTELQELAAPPAAGAEERPSPNAKDMIDWGDLRYLWNDSSVTVPGSLFAMLRGRVQAAVETFVKQQAARLPNSNVTSFEDLPWEVQNKFAKLLVVTVLKVVFPEGSGPSQRTLVRSSLARTRRQAQMPAKAPERTPPPPAGAEN